MPTRDKFQKIFSQLFNDSHLTQAEIAKALKVSRATISCWLRGTAYPRADALERVSNYFSVPVSSLVDSPADDGSELSEDEKTLFRLAKNARPEAIRAAVAVLKSMEDTNHDF